MWKVLGVEGGGHVYSSFIAMERCLLEIDSMCSLRAPVPKAFPSAYLLLDPYLPAWEFRVTRGTGGVSLYRQWI
jgi:hypothetical protein